MQVVWGDGSTSPATVNETTRLFSATHAYLNNPAGQPNGGSFPIVATATDDVGETGSAATAVVVDNVPPAVSGLVLSAGTVNVGQGVTLTGTITDPGILDGETAVVNWGDGTNSPATVDPATRAFVATHTFAATPAGSATATLPVVVTATDSDGGTGTGTTSVVVNAVAPSIAQLAFTPNSINEGSSTTLSGVIGGAGSTDPDTVSVVWGDGSTTAQQYPAGTTTFSIPHVYADNPAGQPTGTFTATATVTDTQTSLAASGTAAVTVANVAPMITAFTDGSSAANKVPAGQPVGFNLVFTDPGSLDTHNVIIGWGDGSQAQTIPEPAGLLNVTLDHPYAKAGTYYVTVQVVDKDGGVSNGKATLAYVGPVPPAPLPIPIAQSVVSTSMVAAPPVSAPPVSAPPISAPSVSAPVATPQATSAATSLTSSATAASSAPPISASGGAVLLSTGTTDPSVILSAVAMDTDSASTIRLLRSDAVNIVTAAPASANDPAGSDGTPTTDASDGTPAAMLFDDLSGEFDSGDPALYGSGATGVPPGPADAVAFGDDWLMLPPSGGPHAAPPRGTARPV